MADRKHGRDGGNKHNIKNSPSKKKTKSDDGAVVVTSGDALQQRKKQLAPIRRNLPVYQHKEEICQLVSQNEALLVVAETGSGKSTQIPAFLYTSGCLRANAQKKKTTTSKHQFARSICVTQPRRVAAITVGKRVAEEMGCLPGTVVGHRVRFDDCTDVNGPRTTRVIYATDGMLLREATSDPLLTRYGIIVLDEAHERSLQTDVLFGVVKRAMDARRNEKQGTTADGVGASRTDDDDGDDDDNKKLSRDELIRTRMRAKSQQLGLPPLKVVVMSATLDVDTFRKFFPSAEMIKVPGRQYPVQLVYTKEPQEVC